MRQIRAHGRGGQGVRVTCRVLAAAFVRAVSAAWAIGGWVDARPETTVTAFVQVDDHAAAVDDLLVLDPALFYDVWFGGIPPNGIALIAGPIAPCARAPGAGTAVTIDAPAIAAECGLGAELGTTMAGAYAGLTRLLALDMIEASVADLLLDQPGAQLAACRAGYRKAAQSRPFHMAS